MPVPLPTRQTCSCRTDFQKLSLTTADALNSWISATIADSSLLKRVRGGDDAGDWAKVRAPCPRPCGGLNPKPGLGAAGRAGEHQAWAFTA